RQHASKEKPSNLKNRLRSVCTACLPFKSRCVWLVADLAMRSECERTRARTPSHGQTSKWLHLSNGETKKTFLPAWGEPTAAPPGRSTPPRSAILQQERA